MNHSLFYFWVGPGLFWKFWGLRWGPFQLVLILSWGVFRRHQRLWWGAAGGTYTARVLAVQLVWKSR